MDKRTELKLRRITQEIFNKVYNKSSLKKLSTGDRTAILATVSILNSSPEYNEFCKKYAKELAKSSLIYKKGDWRKYFDVAKKLHYVAIDMTWKDFELKQLEKAIKQNFTLIKSIPSKSLSVMEHKYTTTLIQQVAKGTKPRNAFYQELKMHGAKNAKMIARTETAKLQSEITKERATELGSVAYIWRSSNDIRTRPSHKMMNNVVVLYRDIDTEKPLLDKMNGDAGGFPNCRCTELPIFDEDDLTQNRYKVYDYRNHKLISMSKNELLRTLENKKIS